MRDFLANVDGTVERACFGVAGPVIRGRAKITNLPWTLDAEHIQRELRLARIDLINDLQAIASAVPRLLADEIHTLNPGEAVAGGSIAVIAPGTGLGEAFLTWNGAAYTAHPSEGGHSDFAPTDSSQIGLLHYMLQRHSHVSYERVCSGLGIPNIYAYLRDSGFAPEPAELARQLAAAPDPNPVIAAAALDPTVPCRLCRATLDLFVEILGAEAGNLALTVLATGGLYVAGGIPRRIIPLIDDGNLLRAFTRKGRSSAVLARIPVHIVTRRLGLLGAALYGLEGPFAKPPTVSGASKVVTGE